MFALGRCSRAVLAACSFTAFAGSFVTAPFAARGAAALDAIRRPDAVPAATPSALAFVVPRRDPFAGAPPARSSTSAPVSAASALPPRQATPAIPGAIGPLPGNAGAAGLALPFAAAPRVTAVVTGRHPFALVDEGGTTRVVTIGDRLDGGAIAAIDTSGVRLAGGTTLLVAPSSPAAAPLPGGRLP